MNTIGSKTIEKPFIMGSIDEETDPTAPTTTCLMRKFTEDDYKNLRRYATVDKDNRIVKGASGTEYTLSVDYGRQIRISGWRLWLLSVWNQYRGYNNDVLYANGAKITVIGQKTGKVTYRKNNTAFDILNKTDHKELKKR